MEQHPIPQPISSYEFRLIGSMTLKQFAKLAGGCVVSLIFYALPLPSFLKWPAVIFFAVLGVGLAFLPINERPLDVWIISFFKAVFSPTQYIWKKEGKLEQISDKPISSLSYQIPQTQKEPTKDIPPAQSTIDKEFEFFRNIQTLFNTVNIPKTKEEVISPVFEKKKEKVEAKVFQEDLGSFALSIPNTICGIVKTKEGKLIDGVILEIKDSQGNPVRALKTNKLGQFRTVTSLPNGTYEIVAEKEGYEFDIIKIELKGEVLPPIEINPAHES